MSGILSLLGWMFLPNMVTSWTQTIYYSITIRAGDPKPQPGTPRHALHRRRILILVVSLYLLYTLYEADHDLRRAGNYYTDLGLTPLATEREVKSRFRRLAALHHPDKAHLSPTPQQDADATNAYFVHLKLAADTLADPVKRFAYERLGPQAMTWTRCSSARDYMVRGVQVILPYYGAAAIGMYALGLFGYLDFGKWWRWVALVALGVFEVHAVTRPRYPGVFEYVVNPVVARFSSPLVGVAVGGNTARLGYLPFEAIALLRKVCVTLYMGFSQLGPLLYAAADEAEGPGAGDEDEKTALAQALERLDAAVASVDVDAKRLLELEMAPFSGDPEALAVLRGTAKEWLVQNTIRADPMVRDALGNSLKRRRTDAPPGARGTK